ncbi:LamG-like jellyroll fold domain-containing protein [Planctomycetes bacterium TBK1r]|uniref:Glycosyl hydrolases family 43 n=1 Tax=Stieleria magnilauensis TaxID=2527963 RepID=A0ABX5XZ91_9BACT|nr:hypothetical protein TBK1r_59610 [Planctomycetes bacterium TBK1r]QDV87012.1 hypothetical protein TBK1r_60390 [Planctomycetes bacterium TBK1r]
MPIADPTDISGCVVWLDPSTLTALSDGDDVTSWADSSGEGNDAAGSGTDHPTYQDGSEYYSDMPFVGFAAAGGDGRLTVSADSTINSSAVTYAMRVRLTNLEAASSGTWLFNKVATNAATVALRVLSGAFQAFCRLAAAPSTALSVADDSPTASGWMTLIVRHNGTNLQVWIDGEFAFQVSASGVIDTAVSGDLVIGNHPTTDIGAAFHLADFVLYDVAVTNSDITDLHNWMSERYPNSEYADTAELLSTGNRGCAVAGAAKTGLAANHMIVAEVAGNVRYYTSTTGSPHTWTDQGQIIAGSTIRAVELVYVGSTWYVYLDDATGNGTIRLFTGSDLSSLTEHASSPVITGASGAYVRAPAVIEESGEWVMIVDRRTDSIAGLEGDLVRYTSSDGISWTYDSFNSPVMSPTGVGFEGSDLTHPQIYKLGESHYLLLYAGYNKLHHFAVSNASTYPHELAMAESFDLISFSRVNKNPLLTNGHGVGAFDGEYKSDPYLWDDGENFVLYHTGAADVTGTEKLGYATGLSSDAPGGADYYYNQMAAIIG